MFSADNHARSHRLFCHASVPAKDIASTSTENRGQKRRLVDPAPAPARPAAACKRQGAKQMRVALEVGEPVRKPVAKYPHPAPFDIRPVYEVSAPAPVPEGVTVGGSGGFRAWNAAHPPNSQPVNAAPHQQDDLTSLHRVVFPPWFCYPVWQVMSGCAPPTLAQIPRGYEIRDAQFTHDGMGH